ncbi:MAG: TraR/DksA family transcriptional regulator [Gammaproteobacteria bacterium]|nr:TraR/DksA family transcriptional regulator [Gammaproteobacteria bacterium]
MPNQDLTTTQLNQLIDLLKHQKKQLQKQLENTRADSQPVTLDQQSVGRVSRIDAIQQQQMAIANREQNKNLLIAINKSLSRFDNDEYGFCLECGEAVGFKRLQVQPHTDFCLACQSVMENS